MVPIPPVPKALARAEDENFGRAMAEAGQGAQHITELPQALVRSRTIFSDESFPTVGRENRCA